MSTEILSHTEMCAREGLNLQRGMTFSTPSEHSVLLMSTRPNAPYTDEVLENGSVLVYEGHNLPRSRETPYPKQVDQIAALPSGIPTENGKFYSAAAAFKNGSTVARRVRVYEKIRTGIWAYNGMFHLIDAWTTTSNGRSVYKFKLVAVAEAAADERRGLSPPSAQHRLIPTVVKREVWKRDEGKCAKCGATNDLHFDHVIPFSKGGSSTNPENVQLLCDRHNIQKSDDIE